MRRAPMNVATKPTTRTRPSAATSHTADAAARATKVTRRSGVAAVDVGREPVDHRLDVRHARIERRRLPERLHRALLVAGDEQDLAEAGERAVVAGLARQGLAHVDHRAVVVAH